MAEKWYDLAIIGGGIVGAATALALSARFRVSMVVLEAEDRLAAHQTGNNSGVIHAGLYYRPGSLKAAACTRGREALYRFCEERGIPHERCGKTVIAVEEDELPRLEELARRGEANGIAGIRRLDAAGIKEIEPHAAGIAGLFVPVTGIVDYTAVTQAYAAAAQGNGVDIVTGARLTQCRSCAGGFVLIASKGEYRCRHLINTAGLQCDRVARLCGIRPGVKIVPFRGEYYTIAPERAALVRHLIYPVPDPRFPFLGVHFTRKVRGGVEAGPNAVLALKREGYAKTSFSPGDALETFLYPGFWRMGMKYWKTGMAEMYRSFSKAAFARALARLVPEIEESDLLPGGAGVRAQAMDASGRLLDDFHIVEAERMIHVLNAPSPAATASMAIGESIADLARQRWEFT